MAERDAFGRWPRLTGGVTRHVVLVGGWAVKVPRLNHGWANFLLGLLGNRAEYLLGRTGLDGYCPVVFGLPGGWLLVQARAHPLTPEEWASLNLRAFRDRGSYAIVVEPKYDSFGWVGDKLVAVDCGEAWRAS